MSLLFYNISEESRKGAISVGTDGITLKTHKRKNGFFRELSKNKLLFLMVLPAVAFVFLFNYVPFAGIVIAFKDFMYNKGIFGSKWVGFKNFEFMFKSGSIKRVTINTVVYNVIFITVDLVFKISVAVILSEIVGKKFAKVSQTMILLPFFVSWVVAGAIVYNILGTDVGIINGIRVAQGLERISFMNTPKYWPYIFVIFHVWKGLGYGTVVYLSAITGIDQEIYEAAEIDGANVFQRIFHVTLPMLKPTVIVLLLLSVSTITKGDFAMFYNLTGNSPLLLEVSDIIDTFVYRTLSSSQNFSMAGAAGIYQSVMGFIIIMTVNGLVRKAQPEYALF